MATITQDAAHDAIEDQQRQAPALIRYLAPGDFVTRRYVRAGAEINTGEYRDYEAVVRDPIVRGTEDNPLSVTSSVFPLPR